MGKLFLGSLCFALMVGCTLDPANRCSVTTEAGACLKLLGITAYSPVSEASSSNVDAWQGTCEVDGEVVAEPFTDHLATISIVNSPPDAYLQMPELSPIVTIDSYSVSFESNECVPDATINQPPLTCPVISGMDLPGPTVVLTADSPDPTPISVPLVPLRKKFEYQDRLGMPGAYSSYTALYVIRGHDAEGSFEIEGSTEFTIGNYDLCPQ